MDGLNWDGSQLVENIPMLWNIEQQELEAGYSMTNLNPSVFYQIQDQMQKAQTGNNILDSNSGKLSDTIQSEAAPTSEIVMNVMPKTNLSQLAATFPVSNFVPDFNMAHHHEQQRQLVNGSQNGKAIIAATCSAESLDCSFSVKNSKTDTSVEDDGISMILSDCRKNLWNFSFGSRISSGESESNASNGRTMNKDMQPVNELEETVSRSSSDLYVNQGKIVESKANCTKRLIDDAFDPGYFSIVQNSSSDTTEGGFRLISENPPKIKRPRWEKPPTSSNINFQRPNSSVSSSMEEPDPDAIAHMKEMIYRAAAFRPVNLGLEAVEKPKRKNVRISSDPQTVAARIRRERISERIRVLQNLVPGGSKMDTASMLDEAANYLKFLRSQVKALESLGNELDAMNCPPTSIAFSFNPSFPMLTHFPI